MKVKYEDEPLINRKSFARNGKKQGVPGEGMVGGPGSDKLLSVVRIICVIVVTVILFGIALCLRDRHEFGGLSVSWAGLIYHFQWLSAFFPLLVLVLCLVRFIREGQSALGAVRTWLPIRLLVYFFFVVLFITSIVKGFGFFGESHLLIRSFFNSLLLVVLTVWILIVLNVQGIFNEPFRGAAWLVDICFCNLVVVLIISEGLLGVWAEFSNSPLLWNDSTISSNIQRLRMKAGSSYFNFKINSDGYHDTEFLKQGEGNLLVAVLADSFGVGVVPFDYNYTTVAERCMQQKLGRSYQAIAVNNYGIVDIGMREYFYLLQEEILATRPSYVVLSVFVGNDIVATAEQWMGRYCLQGWRVGGLLRRLFRLGRSIRAGGHVHTIGRTSRHTARTIPQYVDKTSLEPAHMSEKEFLEIESDRVKVCNTGKDNVEEMYRDFLQILGQFKKVLGDRLIVVLIPDEFQVNDKLYGEIMARQPHSDDFDRDYPQKRISEFCRENNISLLDLLPLLRSAQLVDRTYHLNDTHWNANGNRESGLAICDFILERLPQNKKEKLALKRSTVFLSKGN